MNATADSKPRQPHRGPAWERALSLLLRTGHLMAVIALGAALLGAPVARGHVGPFVLASGAALLGLDLWARRLSLLDLAGVVVLLKLAASAWMAWGHAGALPLFWAVVALSSLSAHAPKALRHWRPGRAAPQSRASRAGRPG
ncbi:hypothetical protein RA210_U40280 [Rubrivivax sp. A210]|uniref:hypothetical protein n=1 Tax=Rubrivivax sp. A210 TaxID=2772301 RepID=UPI00191812D6|nr:hypothetical protein [Rubrivivax sp. A210]CAD5373877.1 hypothetical protein RA210_U40280 [Rubrivivax sp. A210]